MDIVRVGRDYRITLPLAARRALGIKQGDRLSVEIRATELVLRLLRAQPTHGR
jgi:antitoxin PrlF